MIALETKIAAVAWPPERQRSVKETNNPMDRAGLAKLVPTVDWTVVLAGVGLGDAQHFIVNETTAIRDGSRLLGTEPLVRTSPRRGTSNGAAWSGGSSSQSIARTGS